WSGSPDGTRLRLPLASYSAFTFWKVMPVSLPLSWTKATGTRKLRIGISSWIASSFSQGEAFISSKPERTTTLTSSPPRRRAVRQQSIAVLPPPSTITRLPILSVWPNDTEDSQSMPIWTWLAASFRPGMSSSRPRAVLRGRVRQALRDVVLEVGGDALEAADCHRRFLDASAAARRFAWTIAGASQNSGKHVRFPIDHVGVAVAALRDQSDVFGNRGVCRTGPLAIDHFVKVVGGRDIGRFHSYPVRAGSKTPRPFLELGER